MSVAFESNSCSSDTNRIQSQGFSHGMWIYNMSESTRFTGAHPWTSRLPAVKEEEDSTSSSSIGKNSDADAGGGGGDSDEDDGGEEVQSKDNGPLNQLNSLEEVLPIKRGLSSFYAGKSKSYGSLADATSVPNIQDIVKPEDAYSRKRKNMIAHSVLFDKNRKSTTENGGVSKRLASHGNGGGTGRCLPPLPKNSRRSTDSSSSSSSSSSAPRLYCSPWRSLSLSDLQHAGLVSNERNNEDGH